MSYAALDADIQLWANRHSLRLHTEDAGTPRRVCYVPAGEHELFVISVEPPELDFVTINVWDIETEDDAEFHEQWRVAHVELSPTLELAMKRVAEWSKRPLRRRWGESP